MKRSHLCVFCDIVAGETDTPILADWFSCIAFEPLNPVTPGHVLIVPKTHVRDVAEDAVVSGLAIQCASQLAQQMDSCNVITSQGEAATQSVFHLHLHVLPRRFGDGLVLPWTDQQTAVSQTPGGAE